MEIYYKDECYKIVGAAMYVYNVLGAGFLEAVYQEALELEFQRCDIPYEREKEITINYDGQELKQKYKADFVCYDDIIVELKAVDELNDVHRAQVHNYLRATKNKLGVLVNFGGLNELEYERIVYSRHK
jgi:GxxExxY protein